MISYTCVESVLQHSLPHSLLEYKTLAGEYFRGDCLWGYFWRGKLCYNQYVLKPK